MSVSSGRRWLLGFLLIGISTSLIACSEESSRSDTAPLFEPVDPEHSGVLFANVVREDLQINILSFEYLYNGGGVAIGDVTGDSLPDLFFTATRLPNKLYKNLGGFRFEDITESAGVGGRDSSMSTGATIADLNGDGLLDIYVCQTGKSGWDIDRSNLLYINNGDESFTERAAEYGVDSQGFSNQAAVLDYDRDGDLDIYLVNHPEDFGEGNVVRPDPNAPEPFSSDQLFRNDLGSFVDVSASAGIQNYAFGLSATIADYTDDGWLDIYVANDYIQPDFLYANNQDGTFTDRGREMMAHTSHFGMGSDVGDINNDGLQDVVVLDMMAEDARRQRLLGSVMMYDRYQLQRQYGYGEQIMRNTLQLNNGDGTFSEIGQLAGISNTDWSWGPLLADFDLDGFKDLFVANGYRRDVTNLDYMQFTVDSLNRAGGGRARVSDIYEYLDVIPSEELANYAFRNRGDLTFEDVSDEWGLDHEGYSNGASYADLDADGDLDLVVNDIDGTARLFRNLATERYPDRKWLRVAFEGRPNNLHGVGARVQVYADSSVWIGDNSATRGFYSSTEPLVHFGLGDQEQVTVIVTWPDGKWQQISDIQTNQTITVRYDDATLEAPRGSPTFEHLFEKADGTGLDFVHQEDP
ncbi:MAG: CRTAC1 family protein, partial [Rubricoccaceae bacterium]|nr:CRTAC1 family protein [Rubricoccaceae bacterium]